MLPVCRSYSPNNVGRSWLRLKHVTTWLFSECARRTRTRIASGYIRTAIRMAAKASSLRIDWQTFLQSRGPRSAVQRSVIQKCLAHLRDGPASTSSLSHPKWKNEIVRSLQYRAVTASPIFQPLSANLRRGSVASCLAVPMGLGTKLGTSFA